MKWPEVIGTFIGIASVVVVGAIFGRLWETGKIGALVMRWKFHRALESAEFDRWRRDPIAR